MSASAATRPYVDAIEQLEPTLAGGTVPWLRERRRRALAHFAEQGFPSTREEEWKYTSVAAIERQAFKPALRVVGTPSAGELERFLFTDFACQRIVFINGHHAPELSAAGAPPEGIIVGSLAAALEREPERIEPHLGHYAPTDKYGFAALNTALLADGAYVHIPAGVDAGVVHLLFLTVPAGATEPLLAQPRNLIIGERGSRVTVIESYAAPGESIYLSNAITEIVAGEEAVVEHHKLGYESPKAFHIGGLYVHQQRGSRFISHNLTLDGALVRNDLYIGLRAEHAECTLNGLYVARGRQHIDNHTHIDHAAPACTSRELYKGVLDGRGRAVFSGRVVVHPHAQHSDAHQANHNLLLSPDAEVDTKPQLEIYADDVKCGHGATVGQLDESALFYLQSRGVDRETARSVLTYAFAGDVVRRIDVPVVRASVQQALNHRLLAGRSLEELS